MILIGILILEIVLLLELIRRVDPLSAAVLCSIYVIIGQVYMQYRAATDSNWGFSPGSSGEFYFHTNEWTLFFFGVFLAVYISSLGLIRKPKNSVYQDDIQDFLSSPIVRHAYLIFFVFLLVQFATVDTNILWANNQYLLINSASGLSFDSPITRLMKSLTGIFALLAGISLSVAVVARQRLRVALGILLVGLYLLFPLASASRSAALPMAAISITLFAIGGRRHITTALFAAILGVAFFVIVQVGRPSGEYGVSAIPSYFGLLGQFSVDDLINMTIGSFAQGVIFTPDAIAANVEHVFVYKVLSFSPFPSAIDGFSKILPLYEVRLHAFVPMSAVGETFNFGLSYVALFYLTVFLALRANIKAATEEHRLLFIVTSALITIFFITAFTYPLRNVYRYFLLAIVILNARSFLCFFRQHVLKRESWR